jgi:hypothetical protein
MNKSLIVLVLILVIAGQLIVLSSFHGVDNSDEVIGNAVLTVAKWNYVDASFTLSVSPIICNGTNTVEIIYPNGSSINLTATSGHVTQTFTQRFSFQKTGDFNNPNLVFNNGKISLTQNKPLDILFSSDVGNVQTYISSVLASTASIYGYPLDVFTFIIYGYAQVSYSGYGVTL